MSQPLLSILIPTVLGREEQFMILKKRLNLLFQTHSIKAGLIECRVGLDDKRMTIGEKREKLYQMATGLYVWQIDDDDDISDNCFPLIFDAIKKRPDCITFEERCEINGTVLKSNHSIHYNEWEGDGGAAFSDGFHFHRTPFMKSIIRNHIAKSVPVPHIRFGEDHEWSKMIHEKLETEVHIDEEIYIYQHNSKPEDFNERYGLNR